MVLYIISILAFAGIFIVQLLSLQNADVQSTTIRLRALQLRGGGSPRAEVGVGKFGLMFRGCRLPAVALASAQRNGTLVIYTANSTERLLIDGYYWVTSAGSPANDLVRWVVEVPKKSVQSRDPWAIQDENWTTVGASGWIGSESYPNFLYPTPLARDWTVWVEYWPNYSWSDTLTWLINAVWAVGLTVALVAARRGHSETPRIAVATCCFLNATVKLLCGVANSRNGRAYESITNIQSVFINSYMAAAALWAGRGFVDHFLGLPFFAEWVLEMINTYAILGTRSEKLWTHNAIDFFFLSVWLVVRVLRLRAVRRARRLVLADMVCYDQTWARLLANVNCPMDMHWIGDLARQAKALSQACPPAKPRQSFVIQPNGVGLPSALYGSLLRLFGSRQRHRRVASFKQTHLVRVNSYVDCMDQLYCCAMCLHPILISKVRAWASFTRGCFRTSKGGILTEAVASDRPDADSGSLFSRASTIGIEHSDQAAVDFHFCKIKSVQRAVEKLVRSYNKVPLLPSQPLAPWLQSQRGSQK